MCYLIWEQLERSRRQERGAEPLALELPMPLPYWPEPAPCSQAPGIETSWAEIVIDMNEPDELDR